MTSLRRKKAVSPAASHPTKWKPHRSSTRRYAERDAEICNAASDSSSSAESRGEGRPNAEPSRRYDAREEEEAASVFVLDEDELLLLLLLLERCSSPEPRTGFRRERQLRPERRVVGHGDEPRRDRLQRGLREVKPVARDVEGEQVNLDSARFSFSNSSLLFFLRRVRRVRLRRALERLQRLANLGTDRGRL
jgi:hypothetical protein